MSSSLKLNGLINAGIGRLGETVTRDVTSDITTAVSGNIWNATNGFPDKPHRYFLNPTADRNVELPTISLTATTTEAQVGHSLLILNISTTFSITVISSTLSTVIVIPPQASADIAASSAPATWSAILDGGGVSLTTAGGVESLVVDGAGPNLSIQGLTSGAGINLASAAGALTVTNTGVLTTPGLNTVYQVGGGENTVAINAADGPIILQDNATPIGRVFSVQNNAGTQFYLDVHGTYFAAKATTLPASGSNSVIIGSINPGSSTNAINIGDQSSSSILSNGMIIFGTSNNCDSIGPSDDLIIIGNRSSVNSTSSGIGPRTGSICIGNDNLISAGTPASGGADFCVLIGNNCTIDTNFTTGGDVMTGSIAIGNNAEVVGDGLVGGVIAIGQDCVSTGDGSVAIGRSATITFLPAPSNTDSQRCVAIGDGATISSTTNSSFTTSAIAIGTTATVTGTLGGESSIVIGTSASTSNSACITIGLNASTTGNLTTDQGMIAIGSSAVAQDNRSIAIGSGASITRTAGVTVSSANIAIGDTATIDATAVSVTRSIAIGTNTNVSAGSSIAIGTGCRCDDIRSVALGFSCFTANLRSIAIGDDAATTDQNSIALGPLTLARGLFSIAVGSGNGSQVDSERGIAIGSASRITETGTGTCRAALAIGEGSEIIAANGASAQNTVAIGNNSLINSTNNCDGAIAIGDGATVSPSNTSTTLGSIAIGDASRSGGEACIALGPGALAGTGAGATVDTISIGRNAQATGTTAITIGANSTCLDNSICVGRGSFSFGPNSITIGNSSGAGFVANAIAIGNGTSATSGGIAIGNSILSGGANTIRMRGAYKVGITGTATDAHIFNTGAKTIYAINVTIAGTYNLTIEGIFIPHRYVAIVTNNISGSNTLCTFTLGVPGDLSRFVGSTSLTSPLVLDEYDSGTCVTNAVAATPLNDLVLTVTAIVGDDVTFLIEGILI